MSSGLLDNSGTAMGTELLDGQFAQKLTGMPGGLSAMIARQLERQLGTGGAEAVAKPQAQVWERLPGASRAQDFVARHSDAAEAAAAETGIPGAFILSQAAHESGWGKREIRHADGSASHNVFGIKAGANWKGPVAEVTITEYVDGQPRKVQAKFRAYASYDEAFRDYARLIKDSPRYAKVVEQGGSARSPCPPSSAPSVRASAIAPRSAAPSRPKRSTRKSSAAPGPATSPTSKTRWSPTLP